MRVITHLPVSDDKKHFDLIGERWTPVKEPKSIITAMLLSIPIMVVITAITLYITGLFVPFSLKSFGIDIADEYHYSIMIGLTGLLVIPGIFFIMVAHELLHLVAIPDFLRSDKTFVGFSHFLAFVFSEEIISRPRFIAISILPFVVLSIVLPMVLAVFGLYSPLMIFLAWANSVGSSVDILNLILVLYQAPRGSYITSNGTRTYWKVMGR